MPNDISTPSVDVEKLRGFMTREQAMDNLRQKLTAWSAEEINALAEDLEAVRARRQSRRPAARQEAMGDSRGCS